MEIIAHRYQYVLETREEKCKKKKTKKIYKDDIKVLSHENIISYHAAPVQMRLHHWYAMRGGSLECIQKSWRLYFAKRLPLQHPSHKASESFSFSFGIEISQPWSLCSNKCRQIPSGSSIEMEIEDEMQSSMASKNNLRRTLFHSRLQRFPRKGPKNSGALMRRGSPKCVSRI